MAELLALDEAVAELVDDGDTVALEGFTHLIPFAAGHEIIRQRRRDLTLIRMTPDLIYDQLIGAGLRAQAGLLLGRQPRRRLAAPASATRSSTAGRRRSSSRSTATPAWPTATWPAPPTCRSRVLRGYVGTELIERSTRDDRDRSTCPFTRRDADRGAGAAPGRRHRPRPARRPRGQRAALGHHRRAEGDRARLARARWSPSRRSSTSSSRGPAPSCCPPGR